MTFVEFKIETTNYKTRAENVGRIRKDAAKPYKHKIKIDAKHSSMRRDYPDFYVGMETSDYLSQYASLNNRLLLSALKFDYLDRAAPILDASIPECVEDENPDYVPALEPIAKSKKPKKSALSKQTLEKIAEILSYVMDSEESHFEEILDACGRESAQVQNHIYQKTRALWCELELDHLGAKK